MIQKVKKRMKFKKRVSIRKFADELGISNGSVIRIFKQDLGYRSYKKRVQPALIDFEKSKRMKFANRLRHNFRKEDTLTILFSDEKIFDLDSMYNAQNHRIWTGNRQEADKSDSLPRKEWCWVGACSKKLTPLIILNEGTTDHRRDINEIMPVALKYGNEGFGDNWTFQQDGTKAHMHSIN